MNGAEAHCKAVKRKRCFSPSKQIDDESSLFRASFFANTLMMASVVG